MLTVRPVNADKRADVSMNYFIKHLFKLMQAPYRYTEDNLIAELSDWDLNSIIVDCDIEQLAGLVRYCNFKRYHQFVEQLVARLFSHVKKTPDTIKTVFSAIDIDRRAAVYRVGVAVRCRSIQSIEKLMAIFSLMPVKDSEGFCISSVRDGIGIHESIQLVNKWFSQEVVTISGVCHDKMASVLAGWHIGYRVAALSTLEKKISSNKDRNHMMKFYLSILSGLRKEQKLKFALRCVDKMMSGIFHCSDADLDSWWSLASLDLFYQKKYDDDLIYLVQRSENQGLHQFIASLVYGCFTLIGLHRKLVANMFDHISAGKKESVYVSVVQRATLSRDQASDLADKVLPANVRMKYVLDHINIADPLPLDQVSGILEYSQFLRARNGILNLLQSSKVYWHDERIAHLTNKVRASRTPAELLMLIKANSKSANQFQNIPVDTQYANRPPTHLFFSFGYNRLIERCERIANEVVDAPLVEEGWVVVRATK